MNITDDGIDPIGLWFGEQQAFHLFHTDDGVGGLAKWKWGGDDLEILAIHSEQPGTGQLRRFIRWAQDHFSTIQIWHIGEKWLEEALARYGFTKEIDLSGDGEVMDGMRWDRS